MAEYYAVLSRAVASLETSTPEARRAVYDKARNALIAQLKAIVPPLPTSEISRQRLELEEAIRRAEREAASGAAAPPRPAAKRPGPAAAPPPSEPLAPEPQQPQVQQPQSQRAAPPPPLRPEPPPSPRSEPPPVAEAVRQPEPAAGDSPQEVFRRAIREAESRADVVPPPMERAPAREDIHDSPAVNVHVADRPRRAPPPPPLDEEAPYVPPNYHVPRRPEPEPRLAPDFAWEPDPPRQPPEPPRYPPIPELHDDDQPVRIRDGRRKGERGRGRGRDRDRDRDVEADFDERTMEPSRLPTILLLVLIVALVAGLAGLAWWQRGEISRLLASFEGGSSGTSQPVASAPQPPAAPASDTASAKNSDRLPGGNAIATTPGVRVVGETGSPADNNAATTAPADTTAPATATATAETQPSATQGGNAALVAQKAVLYEEPLNSTNAANGVTQINAAVTWTYVANGANGPAVVANLDVPQRGLKIRMTIHKNNDKTLPASHLIEVVVDTTAAFPGKSIASIPRLVLKPSEDARGQPLIGATAKVQDGLFWIALSALPTDVKSNMALLKDRDWIDLPLVYETGQRAILTFEKGTPGDRVLAQAMSAWGTG